MSNKVRPEIALSVYLNEQLLGVLPVGVPHEPQVDSRGQMPCTFTFRGPMAIACCAADAIPLTLYLVGAPAALEAILRNAMKSVTVAINIQSESGYGWGQTYAFDGHEIQCTEIFSTDPNTYALDSNFEAEDL